MSLHVSSVSPILALFAVVLLMWILDSCFSPEKIPHVSYISKILMVFSSLTMPFYVFTCPQLSSTDSVGDLDEEQSFNLPSVHYNSINFCFYILFIFMDFFSLKQQMPAIGIANSRSSFET